MSLVCLYLERSNNFEYLNNSLGSSWKMFEISGDCLGMYLRNFKGYWSFKKDLLQQASLTQKYCLVRELTFLNSNLAMEFVSFFSLSAFTHALASYEGFEEGNYL